MNILFLSRWFPFPPNNGSKLRINHLLHGLSRQHDVTLLSFCDLPLPSPEKLRQHKICSDIHVVPWKPFSEKSLKAQIGFFSSMPRSLVDTYSLQMESKLCKLLKERKFDLVIASQLTMASYYSCFEGMPALFEEIELGLFYETGKRKVEGLRSIKSKLSWLKLQYYISRLMKSFRSGTVVSEKEFQLIAETYPVLQSKVIVLPNCIDSSEYQDLRVDRKPKHIIFSGSFTYGPNYEAMQWFVHKVYPLILSQIPDTQLLITGDHALLPLPKTENIQLTGYVDDVRPLIASCEVSLAPLWNGGGTRLKILEAMAIGTPVVATSKGAEGLTVQNGEHILIADEPEVFAEHVIRLMTNQDLNTGIALNATRLVRECYDWQVTMPGFLGLVEKIAAG